MSAPKAVNLQAHVTELVHAVQWDDHPAIMAVGVVDGTSEAIFQTLMSLGPSRSE